mmetsp:Transcript_30858/g.100457  ORF Transcript_30858/g.100457 Transcript_30858/m.100457 type:complete len:458 (-) Transcript_30858:70-1443(-)
MKVKCLSRNSDEMTRERASDVQKVYRNADPALHEMTRAREYTQALKAAKLERIFAKPFVGALQGHKDGISALATSPTTLGNLVSGAFDGEIRVWDVASRRATRVLAGHTGAVRGLVVTPDGERLVSVSADCTVRLWRLPSPQLGELAASEGGPETAETAEALVVYGGRHAYRDVAHHWQRPVFATAATSVQLWDHSRSEPTHDFDWGVDSVLSVRFNPAEPDLFAATSSDRAVVLYDVRMGSPLRKFTMLNKANRLSWNPREAFNFTVANEDCCLYSFDMRKLDSATNVHKDFVSAVMDVDFSPTGREFVAGAYDRSVRLFTYNGGHSREVYTAKRMQRVFSVRFSGDGTYVFSGSDDMNVRVWKADASEKLGPLKPQERAAREHSKKLVARHKHVAQIRKVVKHRAVPKAIHNADKLRKQMEGNERGKRKREEAHSAPGSTPHVAARKARVLKTDE